MKFVSDVEKEMETLVDAVNKVEVNISKAVFKRPNPGNTLSLE